MKTRNKNVSLIVASALFISPLLASADMSVWNNEDNLTKDLINSPLINEYQKYYNSFKEEFYNDLNKW
jgi:hypothetical protein